MEVLSVRDSISRVYQFFRDIKVFQKPLYTTTTYTYIRKTELVLYINDNLIIITYLQQHNLHVLQTVQSDYKSIFNHIYSSHCKLKSLSSAQALRSGILPLLNANIMKTQSFLKWCMTSEVIEGQIRSLYFCLEPYLIKIWYEY